MQSLKNKLPRTDNAKQNAYWLFFKVGFVTALTVALFFNDLIVVFNDAFLNESTNYILLIPFILVYLVYRKRKTLRAVASLDKSNETTKVHHLPIAIGSLLAATAILLYWYGSFTFTPVEYHMLALPVFLAGLILIFFNTQTLKQAILS